MHLSGLTTALLLGLLHTPLTPAAEPYRGMLLYDMYCHHCHLRAVHLRPHGKVQSLEDLGYQVERWQSVMRLYWRERDIADVQAFLNWRFYRFPESGWTSRP